MHYFIINPVAGNGLSKKVFTKIADTLDSKNIKYSFTYTEYEGHATKLAESAKDKGVKSIIAIGGDGTVLEVASGLFYSDCAFGIIPGGTGNDFIKAVNIPMDPMGALDIILNGHTKTIDTGLCDDKPFLNAFGTGLDAQVVIQTNKVKKVITGFLAYIIGIFAAFFQFDPKTITIDAEDLHATQKMMFLSIANGICIGGGVKLAPQAILDDGYLDILIVDKISKFGILKYLPPLIKGKHLGMSVMHTYKTKKAHITSSTPLIIQIDGEILMKESATVSIREKSLKVYAPAE